MYGHTGDYADKCIQCALLHQKENYSGCALHRPYPKIRTVGNPAKSFEVKENQKHIIGKSEHVEQGDTPLMPYELLQLRSKLLCSNKIGDLQLWMMILISIKLFLRSEEASGTEIDASGNKKPTGIQMESFIASLAVMENAMLKSIGLKIQGKTDTRPVHLMLWDDPMNPELCAIRHLLVYIYVLQLKKGNHCFM